MSQGAIIYTVVYTSTSNPFGETSTSNSELRSNAKKIVNSVDLNSNQVTAFSSRDGNVFNVVISGGVGFICVSTSSFPRRLCFSFLESVRDEYNYKYKLQPSLKTEFVSFLEGEQRFFSENREADKIRGLREQVEEVKAVMLDNIDKVIKRGEALEDIDRKAEELNVRAEVFTKKSKKLKCNLLQKNIKLTFCIVALCLIILVVVGVVVYFQLK
eukprot:TRINITY_DN430_c0_g1_i4.p1 TRINITY_DN430_c0_g1~~TRINITY_DN430_c0_g1_i4.p1  ORF type:complete len:244 (+),score=82.65 TRINITY_DN430_c0_g1_i4:93-734(+)